MKSSKKNVNTFNVVLAGESNVGKTQIVLRFTEDKYSASFLATIGVDFRIRNLTVDGTPVKLHLWDTAGQERYKSLSNNYFRKANAVIFVYDITNLDSFNSIDRWMQSAHQVLGSSAPVMILLGNKCDLDADRQVSQQDGSRFAVEHNMQFFETSAKLALNVEESMMVLARELCNRQRNTASKIEKVVEAPRRKSYIIDISRNKTENEEEKETSSCC